MIDPAGDAQRLEALERRIRELERRLDEAVPKRAAPHYLRVDAAARSAPPRSSTSVPCNQTSGMGS